jgi:hypothetical protein
MDQSQMVIKAPFVTNRQHYHGYPKNVEAAIVHVARAVNDLFHSKFSKCYEISYLILQERVTSNGEVKVVFCGKTFSHIAGGRYDKKSFSSITTQELILFASDALESLDDGQFILDGLVRVDLMCNNEGKLVVNELESLDADYDSLQMEDTSRANAFLDQYWEQKIYDCLLVVLLL